MHRGELAVGRLVWSVLSARLRRRLLLRLARHLWLLPVVLALVAALLLPGPVRLGWAGGSGLLVGVPASGTPVPADRFLSGLAQGDAASVWEALVPGQLLS